MASSTDPTPSPAISSPTTTTTPSAVTVCFTPCGNCTDAIIQSLHDAKRTVLVQAYSFTSAPIAKALLEAHNRGVQVQVILDKSQRTEKYSFAAGVDVNTCACSIEMVDFNLDYASSGGPFDPGTCAPLAMNRSTML